MPRVTWFLLALPLVVFCTGCRERVPVSTNQEPIETRYADLPLLRRSTHPELRAELGRIEEEGATPSQLDAATIPAAENVAAALIEIFPREQLPSILAETECVFPNGLFPLEGDSLHKVRRLRDTYARQRRAVHEALRRPRCRFPLNHTAGVFADTSCLDTVRIAARLEAAEVALELAANHPHAALEPFWGMLRLADHLAAEPHVTARLEAAFLRAEAGLVLAEIVRHPATTFSMLGELSDAVRSTLENWTEDRVAWIGDRALGMHTYEVIRDGYLRSLLTPEEIGDLKQQGILKTMVEVAASPAVNEDELFYLHTMRNAIAACGKPYVQRTEFFQTLQRELQRSRAESDYPLLAARLMLPNMQEAHEIQAQDRALWEAWGLALAVASGKPRPPYEVNPVAGEPYHVSNEESVSNENVTGAKGKTTVWYAGVAGRKELRTLVIPWPADRPTAKEDAAPVENDTGE